MIPKATGLTMTSGRSLTIAQIQHLVVWGCDCCLQCCNCVGFVDGGAIDLKDLDTAIALNLLTQGIAIEVITKATGLTIAQIQQLQDGHRS